MKALSEATIQALPAAGVSIPAYRRQEVTVGIAHFGVGGFHRAHQAVYIDELMAQGLAMDWGICGIGVLPGDAAMAEALRAQDHLYTLCVKHPDGRIEDRVIGSIVDFLHAPADEARVLETLSAPATRIVSLTITEGGYEIDPGTREFAPSSEGARHDVAGLMPPRTAFGFIV
jgi:mannitol 2-dehydrogenase